MGNGSQWMEFDLELALDLGVVRLEGATIRMTLQPFSVELRGLTARMKIENVLEGRGSVTVGQAGAFRALLALQIIPAKLGAYGSLAVDRHATSRGRATRQPYDGCRVARLVESGVAFRQRSLPTTLRCNIRKGPR
jgi:hypothetical protein